MGVEIYPERLPYETGFLPVGDGHALYLEWHGNPDGVPVVYLHGGPGAGSSFQEYRWFNPDHYNVLLFDQRGAGKSTPYASVDANDANHLVADIERLRKNFGIDSWAVAGGSWGSSLAMLYAAQHPDRVERLLLRGIYFADCEGKENIIEEFGVARTRRNEWFENYRALVAHVPSGASIMQAYYNLLMAPETAVEAARRFDLWDTSIATAQTRQDLLDEIDKNPEASLGVSRIFFHFSVHEFSDRLRQEILAGMKKFTGPVDIIHGREDYICPVKNAIALHQAVPHSRLHIVEGAGHSMLEPGIRDAFVSITDRWVAEAENPSPPAIKSRIWTP